MKFAVRAFFVFILICTYQTVPSWGAAPFEDFSDRFIDPLKLHGAFWNSEGTDVVREVVNGKFVSKIKGITADNGHLLNQLDFSDPDTINSFSAKIVIQEAAIDPDFATSTWSVGAQLEGVYYKDSSGDVWAGITLGYDGSQWFIACGVNTPDGYIAGPSFTTTIEPGKEYTVSISYDGTKTFTFEVNDESQVLDGPDRVGGPESDFRGLTTGIWSNGNGMAAGYIYATFDDIQVNGASYDDFSSPHLSATNWWQEELIREIRSGKMQMDVQDFGDDYTVNAVYVSGEYRTDYLQADLTISSATEISDPAIKGYIKVYGSYFNTKYDGITNHYNENDGDIWAGSVLAYKDNGNPIARAYVYRCDDADCNTGEYLFQQDFSCTTQLDVPATLSVEKRDTTLVFRCNGSTLSYQLSGTLYPSHWNLRKIRSTIESSGINTPSYLRATVDNVYIKKPAPPWNLFLPAILSQHANK